MRSTSRSRMRRRAAALGVAGALLASSCAGSFEEFERAVELAMEKGTVRMEGSTVLRGFPGPDGQEGELIMLVEASFDLQADIGDLTLSMDFSPPPPAGEAMLLPCRMILEQEIAVYVKDAHNPVWYRFDKPALEDGDDPFANDPRDAFEFLRAVFGDVEGVGFEEVRGVETRRWRAWVDIDRLLEAEEGAAPRGGFLSSFGANKLPMDVWIDSDGLPRRIAYTIREQAPRGASFEMESTTDIFDYGEPLSVEIPPASEIRDEPDPGRAFDACMGAPAE